MKADGPRLAWRRRSCTTLADRTSPPPTGRVACRSPGSQAVERAPRRSRIGSSRGSARARASRRVQPDQRPETIARRLTGTLHRPREIRCMTAVLGEPSRCFVPREHPASRPSSTFPPAQRNWRRLANSAVPFPRGVFPMCRAMSLWRRAKGNQTALVLHIVTSKGLQARHRQPEPKRR